MLEQMLKKLFESDQKAASGSGSEHIKAGVLSRIEMERSMKRFRIKPLIIAAVVAAAGLMSVVLTVSASIDPEISEKSKKPTFWHDGIKESLVKKFKGDEYLAERHEIYLHRLDIALEYYDGKIAQTRETGEIKAEKELDETDVSGFVEPYRMFSYNSECKGEYAEEQLKLVKQLEEDPESFGLIPVGKSETFQGGLRIVNRHFENINEYTDGGKKYYSFRRVYTDDADNRLIASLYLGCQISFPIDERFDRNIAEVEEVILNVLLDHTEDGCLFGYGSEFFASNAPGKEIRNYGYGSDLMGDYILRFEDSDFKSLTDDKAVTVGAAVAVSDNGIQWLD